ARDVARAEAPATMYRLLASADVFLENFRDGQLDKQGLGPEELRRKHPHLIVAGHKGVLSGPYEHRAALDEVVQMMSGLARHDRDAGKAATRRFLRQRHHGR